MDLEKLIIAIKSLSMETKPKWGKMNSSQMLWHCKMFIILYRNEKNYHPNLMTKTFGYLHLCFLKYIIKWDYNKYPKNTFSLNFFNPKRAKNIDFEKEKMNLIEKLKMVNEFKENYVINPMHGKVSKEIFKEVIRGHTAYHLNQFGVL